MHNPAGFDAFLAAYIEAALWSSMDEANEQGGEPLDSNYTADDLDPALRAQMEEDCRAFLQANADDIGQDYGQAGHDFWLTRNSHGAGFWDGDWPADAGRRLTQASDPYGSVDLYVGDDGMIYG